MQSVADNVFNLLIEQEKTCLLRRTPAISIAPLLTPSHMALCSQMKHE
jgi:hypothetical protein